MMKVNQPMEVMILGEETCEDIQWHLATVSSYRLPWIVVVINGV